MSLKLSKIKYEDLNPRQQENFNFQKISSILADYGFVTMRLNDDWQGADFIANHINGDSFLKIQLKSRLTFDKKYLGKDIHITFIHKGVWYLFPHDELLAQVPDIFETESWKRAGGYSYPTLSKKLLSLLAPYKVFPPDED